jgi:glyoxylase-like metal-dependent hydrolase (beta-lactamase superfamily II)
MTHAGTSGTDRHAWAEPGVEDLGGGVYRIPLPLPGDALTAVNVYALTGPEGLDLIDGGMALSQAKDRLAGGLREIGFEFGDIRNFFVTHVHRDHYTLAVDLRRTHRMAVGLGSGEAANLAAAREMASGRSGRGSFAALRSQGAGELADQLAAARAAAEASAAEASAAEGRTAARSTGSSDASAEWADPDRWIDDGTELEFRSRTLRAIHTPGHTRGHLVFHDPAAATLFTGDHVLPHITPSIGFEPVPNRLALRDYLGSLQLMLTLPDAKMLPAHGPVSPSTHARVRELLEHHEVRLARTLEAVADGASTGYEVAKAIPWTRRERKFADLDLFNQLLATNETVAHLEVLALRGQLTRITSAEGVDSYHLPV